MYKKKLGKTGEKLACDFLKSKEYIIIGKNFSCVQGEIDIIAYDISSMEIVFVEVKARTNFNYGFPSDSVNMQKKRHILNSAKYYLFCNKLENCFVRFDVIEIVFHGGEFKLNHLKNVFW